VPKFLIEVPHESDSVACSRAVQVFLSTGSHFLSNADWGCKDGVHSAWMIVEVESKAEALGIVPPGFRAGTRIVGLNRFELAKIEAYLARHAHKESPGG
jgi:hypothetical protein